MDGYCRTRPLYFFVLRTGKKAALNLDNNESDKLLRHLIADNSSRIFRTDLSGCDVTCEQPVAAISGSSLPFGCWESPKVAASVAKDLHILAINYEIPWTTYKWVDVHGFGMHMPAGGYDEHSGYCYEPKPDCNRMFEERIPDPGKEIVIISEKWGVYDRSVKYISVGGEKVNEDKKNNNKPDKLEAEIESQMTVTNSETTESESKHQTSDTTNNALNHSNQSQNGTAVKSREITREEDEISQQQTIVSEKCAKQRHVPRLHSHRPHVELEPEEGLIDDSDLDPNYGKPEPYKFGKKLSLKMPWKKEKREVVTGPASCSSSISSTEGVKGETWTQTGSLPAIFRKRSLSLTLYFVDGDPTNTSLPSSRASSLDRLPPTAEFRSRKLTN